jgi:hypothetical protein
MVVHAQHIPYSRIDSAIRSGDLSFLLAHRESLSLATEAEMCRLIAEQQPARLDTFSVEWIREFAAQAVGQRRPDYARIVEAFDRFPLNPDLYASQLVTLCAARGIEP